MESEELSLRGTCSDGFVIRREYVSEKLASRLQICWS